MTKKSLPLEGVKVVELGTHVAVPNAARFLADWGAEVVKVEGLSGDAWRIVGRNQLCKTPTKSLCPSTSKAQRGWRCSSGS